MTNEEKVFKYLNNEMNDLESKTFENEIEKSDELKALLQKYRSVLDGININKKAKLNPVYLDSIIPEFHNRMQRDNKISLRKNLSVAFGVMLLFITAVVLLKSYFSESEMTDMEEFTQSLNENQKLELLENLNGETENYSEIVPGNEFVGMLESDLEVNTVVAETYDLSFEDLISDLSESQLKSIYEEILNRNILEEVTL